jgi:hypothetical protein
MNESIDTALKERVRSVLSSAATTEAVFRRLLEEGRACLLILQARLEETEGRLAALSADPEGSLAETATAFREAGYVRANLEELETLLDALEQRARKARASWLSSSAPGLAKGV